MVQIELEATHAYQKVLAELGRPSPQIDPRPVSYTHLDVYKRQPQERILPGRMIREMVRNLETRYELYEYSLIKSERQLEEMDDVVATVPLAGGGLQKGKLVRCV